MIKRYCRLWAGLFLLLGLSSSGWAQVIHWELDGYIGIPGTSENNERTFSGGFDFNTVTQELFNITVMTSGGSGCYLCFDYSDGTGRVLRLDPPSPNVENPVIGVELSKRVDFEPPVYRNNYLRIFGFNVFEPGTYPNLDLGEEAYFFINQPLDPDIDIQDGCSACATLVGTTVPIPEPETYAMLLAGLGVLGFRSRRKLGAR